ncbi:hypothetical protein [Lacrimispora indolis]|uniref:hypothetical protein n=1 Tax=Lacrimispora indolis TaxID=69825 RepID=UPI00045EA1AA|nr:MULTISPECIES: hypothetical protein [Lachnospiraceae]
MSWSFEYGSVLYGGVRILQVTSDEAGGELVIRTDYHEKKELDIVYEGMYYSQLDEQTVGQRIIMASEIKMSQLKWVEYRKAADRLYQECGISDGFLWEMQHRGSRLFAHHTENGKYIVVAKRLTFGEAFWKKAETPNRRLII